MGVAVDRIRAWAHRLVIAPLLGERYALPAALVLRWPELAGARWRLGGLPLRIGGWCLGQSTVQGITLWRTVFLAPTACGDPTLLLHEYRHVEQFQGSAAFPFLYVWESLTRGYVGNRYELDANATAVLRRDRPRPTILPPGA
jgi:hypothetical protein